MCADEADGRLFPSVLIEQCSGLDVCQGSVVKVTPPCQKMAGVEQGCGLGPGPPAQEELLLFRNYEVLRYGRGGNRDFGNLNAWETAVCCLLHLPKQKLLPYVNAPAAWICAQCSSGWSQEG